MNAWLWPDHRIGKRESRQLREEHNKLVNSHADLVIASKQLIARDDEPYHRSHHRSHQRLGVGGNLMCKSDCCGVSMETNMMREAIAQAEEIDK